MDHVGAREATDDGDAMVRGRKTAIREKVAMIRDGLSLLYPYHVCLSYLRMDGWMDGFSSNETVCGGEPKIKETSKTARLEGGGASLLRTR